MKMHGMMASLANNDRIDGSITFFDFVRDHDPGFGPEEGGMSPTRSLVA